MNRMIRPSALDHFLEHRLEPVFEFAAKLRTGDQRPQIKRNQPAVLQAFGNVSRNDPLRQPLDDRRLPDARLTDQDRVVLGPPGEHLHHPPDFRIAADHRVHLAVLRQPDQVAAVSLERLVLVFRRLIRDSLPAANLLQGLQHLLFADPERAQQRLGPRLDLREPQQQVLDRDVLVLHPRRLQPARRRRPGSAPG